ncbi:xylulokinase [Microbacterium sp. YY-01]|uniref:xylulokinase n=1 Tax=Microbacterium sp. YY-01 TaxID=3421634 RepID=UPI003D169EF4
MTHSQSTTTETANLLRAGKAVLGIELGSTRIKACLIDPQHRVVATGSHAWENSFDNRLWTYPIEAVWEGLQAAYAALVAESEQRYGVRPHAYAAAGISGMMHGYLPFDASGNLLAPFRTWRNTNTVQAAAELSELLEINIPLRWSIAHLHQAMIDNEPHAGDVQFFTTLAGYVHEKLTGRRVLGVGDASGMFPTDSATCDWDAERLGKYQAHAEQLLGERSIRNMLPEVLSAGDDAGVLTAEGAALLDPTGALQAGVPMCAPEGDAGTGMVATHAVAPRTGNVSAGTSIFAMVVLERPLRHAHPELDLVTTPAGDAVAMVHCNNGASELAAWVGMFAQFAEAAGWQISDDDVYETLFTQALQAEPDAGGLVAYNYLAGEPITGLEEGRPLFVRTPDSRFTLANAMRAQLYGVFGTLSLGMQVLESEGVELDRMYAHGGMFKTAGVAQRLLAAALRAPVAVGETASEGGAWGIAVLAAYLGSADTITLSEYLDTRVFADTHDAVAEPDAADVAGYLEYLDRYRAGLAIEAAAVDAL